MAIHVLRLCLRLRSRDHSRYGNDLLLITERGGAVQDLLENLRSRIGFHIARPRKQPCQGFCDARKYPSSQRCFHHPQAISPDLSQDQEIVKLR